MSIIENLNKMKIRGNKKTILFAIALAALLASSTFGIIPLTGARNVAGTIPTYAYLTAYPAEVSIGQTIFLAMWIDKVTPTAAGIAGGDLWGNFTITVTLPDKSTTKLGPFIADNAGGAAATYVPTADGNYTFVFNFPGMTITGNANTGVPAHPTGPYIGDVYAASTSLPSTVSVGPTPAYTIPENPIPTGYWQSPVEAFNHQWYSISGDWLGLRAGTFGSTGDYGYAGNYNPYTQPVLSAHIIWTKPEAFGGQIGAQSNTGSNPIVGYGNETSIYYTGAEYQPKFQPIIIDGVLYYNDYPSSTTETPSGWVALSLRTGQVLWTKNTTDVLFGGQLYNYKSINMYGAFPYLWAGRGRTAPTKMDCFDALTGHYIGTINNIPTGAQGTYGGLSSVIEGSDGSLLQYYVNTTTVTTTITASTITTAKAYSGNATNIPGSISVLGAITVTTSVPNSAHLAASTTIYRNASLTLWNSTLALYPSITSQWYSGGQNFNDSYGRGIEWSVQLPQGYQGNQFYYPGVGPSSMSIRTIDQQDQIIVLSVAPGNLSSSNWEVQAGYTMGGTPDGVSGKAQQLWMANNTIVPFTTRSSGSSGDGVYTEYQKETMQIFGYNVHTGAPVWNAYYNDNPLAYYDQQSMVYGNGELYVWTFGGWVYDFNMSTGNTIWKWSDGSAGENTPYGVNPLWIIDNSEGTLAGGVFYVETGHNYGPPLFSGAQIYAINATSGTLMWKFLNFASTSELPVTYGYMLSFNNYDLQIYAYGRGLTQTTVNTTPYVNSNKDLLITGTVTDQSPGQTCLGIPEAGTPAIADPYMSDWMAYLFEQSPEPMNATGVPVTLTYIDPNNNTGTIGTAYSDITGHFSYKFTPPVPGAYTIIATFGGSHSYFSSTAQTTIGYDMAPSATAAPTATPTSVADLYFVPSVIAIIVIIIIGFAVLAVLALRKHP